MPTHRDQNDERKGYVARKAGSNGSATTDQQQPISGRLDRRALIVTGWSADGANPRTDQFAGVPERPCRSELDNFHRSVPIIESPPKSNDDNDSRS